MNSHTITLAAVLAGLSSLFMHSPETFRTAVIAALWLMIADTGSGLVTAWICREVSSHKFRTRLFGKAVQYFILISLCGAASLLAQTWAFANFGAMVINCAEVLSLLENLARLQEKGGVRVPDPFGKLIRLLAGFFSVTAPSSLQCDRDPRGDREGEKGVAP